MITDINPYSGFRPLPRCSFQSPNIVTSGLYVSCKAGLSQWSSSRIDYVRRPLTPFSSHFYFGIYLFDLFWQRVDLPSVPGVGVTDMSLLMTSWSSRLDRRDVEDVSQRVGSCLADAGPSITVTSLSISVALSAAYTSSFPSVANFGLYAGECMGPSARRRPVSATPLFILIVSTCHL